MDGTGIGSDLDARTSVRYGPPVDRRLTSSDIAAMRRSLAMSPSLPAEQLAWLLDEADRLVTDRARLAELTRRLRGPWSDVRTALNELHRLTDS